MVFLHQCDWKRYLLVELGCLVKTTIHACCKNHADLFLFVEKIMNFFQQKYGFISVDSHCAKAMLIFIQPQQRFTRPMDSSSLAKYEPINQSTSINLSENSLVFHIYSQTSYSSIQISSEPWDLRVGAILHHNNITCIIFLFLQNFLIWSLGY